MTRAAVSAVADAIRDARSTVVLTGAGVSAESGVPTFRGDGGIWDRFSESDFTILRFERDPDGFWHDWVALHEALDDDAAPNAAHEALANLERAGHVDAVVTQNVDGLHRAAGSETVVHLHGSAEEARCRTCGESVSLDRAEELLREMDVAPHCPNCNDALKPDATLFGEPLPEGPLQEARTLAERSDCFVVVGSSLTVEPAASLPSLAAEWGATLVEVNPEETHVSADAAYVFRDAAGDVLPEIAAALDDPPSDRR